MPIKWNKDNVQQYIESNLYKLLSIYKSYGEKLKLQCNNNHIYFASFAKFKRGRRCPICANQHRNDQKKITIAKIQSKINKFNGYKLLSTDYASGDKIKFICPIGHEFKKTYAKIEQLCPICSKLKQNKKSAIKYEKVKSDIENVDYQLLSEYKNMKTKLKIQCNKNHIYKATYEKFLRVDRCPICCQTKGEDRIYKYLTNKNIKFQPQFRFTDCRIKYPLPFDFAIFNNNGDINCLIEYDGIQHYKSVTRYGTEEDFKKRQYYDNVKNEYCFKNNIKLIRIPYWDFNNIEIIIDNILIIY